MAIPNPLAALNAINPSLVGYTGGYGKALQALGGSMDSMGQAKLDLAKQAEDERIRNAQLSLLQNADVRAQDAVKQGIADKAAVKQDKFDSNVANNSYLYGAMGKEIPGELTNERAQLGLMDPSTVAAAMKSDKKTYKATDGGLIFNEQDPNDRFDLRDVGSKDNPLKNFPSMPSIVNGKYTTTYFDPHTFKPVGQVVAPGTPTGVYGMQVADKIGDENTGQRPKITNNTTQEIHASNAIANGGMPIAFDPNPKIAKLQKQYAIPLDSGGWYVPKSQIGAYQKQFPPKLPTLPLKRI